MEHLSVACDLQRATAQEAQKWRMRRLNTSDPVRWCECHMNEEESLYASKLWLRTVRRYVQKEADEWEAGRVRGLQAGGDFRSRSVHVPEAAASAVNGTGCQTS